MYIKYLKSYVATFWKILFFLETCLYLIFIIWELIDNKFCVFIGDNGHLDWFQTIHPTISDNTLWIIYKITFISYFLIPSILGMISKYILNLLWI